MHRTIRGAFVLVLLAAALAVAVTARPRPASASTAVGTDAGTIAAANLGGTACGQNSAGGYGFGSSCTGNAGQPEYWCADFVKWAWEQAGAITDGLDAAAGSFYLYGDNQGTLHTEAGYSPSPGDAIVYDYAGNGTAAHVGIVTAVNPDGSLETANGDFGGQSGDEATFSSTSTVQHQTIAASQVAVGSVPSSIGMTISAYVTPRTPASGNPNLLADGGFEDPGTGPWQCVQTCGVDHGLGNQLDGTGNGWARHDSGWVDIHQTVAVQPHTRYHLSGWLRTSSNSDNGYFGVRNTPDNVDATVLGEEHFGTIDGYTYLQQDVDSGTDTSLTVYGGVWTDNGDIWLQLDDVSLTAA